MPENYSNWHGGNKDIGGTGNRGELHAAHFKGATGHGKGVGETRAERRTKSDI